MKAPSGAGEEGQKSKGRKFGCKRKFQQLLLVVRENLGLGFYFCGCPKFSVSKLPPCFCVCSRLLFIDKNIARSPNLVPQLLLFFFVNLIFLIVFGFFLSTLTRMRKIIDFKNNA